MSLFDFLKRRVLPRSSATLPLLASIDARIPADGAPGLLPLADPAQAEAERRLGERFAAELHAYGAHEPAGLARRAAAVASAASRRKPRELEEALSGLSPWELPSFLEGLGARKDLQKRALAETARKLIPLATGPEVLAAAVAMLAPAVDEGDRDLLLRLGRSTALAGICAMVIEGLGPAALLELARFAEGLGRALALERLGMVLAEGKSLPPTEIAEALRLAGTVEDPVVRAYGAVPLLETGDVAARLEEDPALAEAVARCLEAAARGGWNGGPGPGLGRMPGGTDAAFKLLSLEAASPEAKRLAARAVLDSHPMPAGPVRKRAEEILAG